MASLLSQAKKLGKSKYSPVFKEIEMGRTNNRSLYDTATGQRIQALNREVGSINAANATYQNRVRQLGLDSATMFQQALASSQARASEQRNQSQTYNTNMLSSLQAERLARGLDPQATGIQADLFKSMASNQTHMDTMQSINEGALQRQQGMAQEINRQQQNSGNLLTNSANAQARGAAQGDLNTAYNTYLAKRQELETAKVVKESEKADYIYQTYLTLKEQAAQRKAEAAALAQEYAYKGAVLSETQRHNMQSEANTQSRLNLDAQKFSWKQLVDEENLKLKKDKQGKATKPSGFNDANTYAEAALSQTGLSKPQQKAILTGIKTRSPLMSNGQSYSRNTPGYIDLLTGGGNKADLNNYLDRLIKYSGSPTGAKGAVEAILLQYGLIAGKKA